MLDEEFFNLLLRLCGVSRELDEYASKRALERLTEIDLLFEDFLELEDALGLVYRVEDSKV